MALNNVAMAMADGGSGGAAANEEVFYDWNKISSAAEELSSILDTFKGNVDSLYEDVKNLNNSWAGPSYDAFKANCENYKTKSIEPLINNISNWVTKLQELAAEAKSTSATNASYFQQ